MDHRQIRIRILENLYDWFYQGNIGNLKQIEEVIRETNLVDSDRNLIKAEVEYLRSGGFVSYTQQRTPDGILQALNISAKGIDYIDTLADEFLRQNHEGADTKSLENSSRLKQAFKTGQSSINFLNSLLTLASRIAQGMG